MAFLGTFRIQGNRSVLLASNIQLWYAMPKSIASQSHCFADWSFIVEWSHNIIHYHTCVQKPLEAPKMPNSCEWSERAGVGSLQSPSEQSPTRRTAWRNHSDFQGAWKFWACWHPLGHGALWEHVRTALIFPIPTQTPASQSGQKKNQGWPADFYFLMLMVRFTFAGARRMQRSFPNACSGRKIQGRDVPAR